MSYSATLKVMGQTYSATGKTPSEAIFSLKPKNAKGRGILTVKNGDVVRERVLPPTITSRLFNSVGLNREVALKNISIMFEGI